MGAGTGQKKMRLGKDAIKGFDCCSLTLQPTSRPVVSPQGYIFDKEAIFSFILEKKKTYEKQMKEFERQKQEEIKEFRDKAAQEEEEARERFEETEKNIVTKRVTSKSSEESGSTPTGVSNMSGSRKRELPSFWLPSMCPDAKKSKLVKPDKTVYCPMSGKPLKVKDLTDVVWTEVKDPDNKKSMMSREERYQCAVTGDTLYNSTPCAVLKTTGHVVTVECVEKIIKKDWTHPLTVKHWLRRTLYPLVRGATGFSAANDQLIAESHRPMNAIS